MYLIKVITGDITRCKADAIVNAANTSLLGGGGVDGAIHRAAGPGLKQECEQLGGCGTGEARITRAYQLPAKYVIHTPGPVWRGGGEGEAQLLESSYLNCLRIAEAYNCHKVAFPSISTGVYAYPVEEAAKVALRAMDAFRKNSVEIDEAVVVCFDKDTYAAYRKAQDALRLEEIEFA